MPIHLAAPPLIWMMALTEELARQPARYLPAAASLAKQTPQPANAAKSAALAYQPEDQLIFLLVERLIEVNLYSTPTEMAKFTSYCE
jgi:hypothetical protein